MAKRKDIEASSGDPAAKAAAALEQAQPKSDKSELPMVESPSISPASPEPKIEPIAEVGPAIEAPATPAPENFKRLAFTAFYSRNAFLAASVAIAAALGAVVGAVASGGFSTPLPHTDVAGVEERKTMEQSISQLANEVTALKANVEAASKNAHNQIAAVAAQPPARASVVQDWTIRETRDGLVYVQGHGDVYQVVPGAPLPGLGPVESVKRQDGRWMVVTPKGIIVSMRDRRYFGSF
jgi:hypothetical protein